MSEDKKMKGILKEVLEGSIYLLVVLAVTLFIITFIGQRTVVHGPSMNDYLQDNDNLIVDKLSYRFSDPTRYDIIVFPYEQEKHTYFIKRIIGLPGETVRIEDNGDIYINGELLDEDYGREVIKDAGIAKNEITLGSDEYFVMGDNRNNSKDSRFSSVGNIKREDIIGKAWVRIFPFDSIEMIKHQ